MGDTACMVCGLSSDVHLILLCDGCNNEAHMACVGLSQVPAGDWFCSTCRPPSKLARTVLTDADLGDTDEVDGIVIEAFADPLA